MLLARNERANRSRLAFPATTSEDVSGIAVGIRVSTGKQVAMPRTCTVCSNRRRPEIDAALLSGAAFRNIAQRFRLGAWCVYRHKRQHLAVHLVKAKDAAEILDADRLITHLQSLRKETLGVLAAAKRSRDSQMALKAIARAEAQLRLAAELLGELGQLQGAAAAVTIVFNKEDQAWL
jgi:hypothetical protein